MEDEREQDLKEEERAPETQAEPAGDEQAQTGESMVSPGTYPEEPGDNAGDTAESKPIGFLELVYGILFDPRRTFEAIAPKPPIGMAIVILIIVMVLSMLSGIIAMGSSVIDPYQVFGEDPFRAYDAGIDLGSSIATIIFIAPFILFIYLLVLFIYSGYLHIVGEVLGGRGSSRGVFVVVCLSQLPYIFDIPVTFVAQFLGYLGIALMVIANIGVFVWSVVIQVLGLSKTLRLSTGRSTLAVFSPLLLMLIFIFLLLMCIAAIVSYSGMEGMWY